MSPDADKYSYMPNDGSERAFSLETGRTLFYRKLVSAEDKTVHVCIISSLKDVALFLRDNEALFVAKVEEVSIMGGVVTATPGAGERSAPGRPRTGGLRCRVSPWESF